MEPSRNPALIDRNECHDLIVLGAGFSKAVSTALPLTDELGEKVRESLCPADQSRLPSAQFAGGRFEEWLSYLAEDHPYLSEDQTHEARALLYRITQAIREVLGQAQLKALETDAPKWFYELLSVLHVSQATVVTMNYDNLIECGVESTYLPARTLIPPRVGEEDILCGLPPSAEPKVSAQPNLSDIFKGSFTPPVPLGSPSHARSFRLLKLHGSLSWYWVPGDPTGTTLQRWRLPGLFGQPSQEDDEVRQQALPGREVFIVPPAAFKSEQLRNPIVRELWRSSNEAFRTATRIVLIGYSLPVADRSFSGMLTEALKNREIPIEIVNTAPSPVVDQLIHLGVPSDSIKVTDEDKCVERWTSSEVDRLATAIPKRLLERKPNRKESLDIAGLKDMTGVAKVVPLGAGTASGANADDLVVKPYPPGRPVDINPPQLPLDELKESRRIVVEVSDRHLPVVNFEVVRHTNPGLLDQVVLVVAGKP